MKSISFRYALGALVVVCILLLANTPAGACLWDQDTLKDEAKGIPEVVDVVTGWFDRQPALYYQMRLERVAAAIAKDPTDLEAYDDAGVACDRLGNDDDAIEWMGKKLEQLNKRPADDPVTREHRYRYLSNLGTFWVHRWARGGADRARIDEVRKARDYIAEALKINPNAHFGREKYQLMALQWIVDPPLPFGGPATQPYDLGGEIPNFLSMPDRHQGSMFPLKEGTFGAAWDKEPDKERKSAWITDALKGLSGLVVLGNAWESVDVFIAMGTLVRAEDRMSVVRLVRDRIEEITKSGKGSFYPLAPRGDALMKCLEEPFRGRTMVQDFYADQIDEFYKKARAAADARNAAREAFMLDRLSKGRHPDTDPKFWDGWVEPPKVELPEPRVSLTVSQEQSRNQELTRTGLIRLGIALPIFAALLILYSAWRSRLKKQTLG